MFRAICSFITLVAVVQGFDVIPTEPFFRSATLDDDGNYHLFWDFNETHVTFEAHVRTRGYVGFGLSTSGKMFPADVVVGWVKDGRTYFKDRHTTSHYPETDKSQDWYLIHGAENDFGTVLKFGRKLVTCDDDDFKIEEGTVRLIYSYHPDDPTSESSLVHHGYGRRGTKSVSLLYAQKNVSSLPSNTKTIDFLNENFVIPAEDTRYQCKMFRMPNLGQKHHILKFEPIISPGNAKVVHHMLLNKCSEPDPNWIGKSYPCYVQKQKGQPKCLEIYLIWAVGGTEFYFPDVAALPVGHEDEPAYYELETHYDNPTLMAGIIDNSGLRITVTTALRPVDAGLLMLGQTVNFHQFIPPQEKAFVQTAYCPANFIDLGLDQANLTEVTAFGYMQHEHLTGRGVKARHFRNGTELPPITNDPHYDFNFQETRLFKKETPIRKGDSFVTECLYDSSEKTNVIYGGFSTREEMCFSVIYIYPAIPVTHCVSHNTLDAFGKNETELRSLLDNADWSDPVVRREILNKAAASTQRHVATGHKLKELYKIENSKEKPVPNSYIEPLDEACKKVHQPGLQQADNILREEDIRI